MNNSRTFFEKTYYFFPFQLLLFNLKKNYALLLFWLLLFMAILNQLGTKYGIPYLYLTPEYLGEVSFWSFAIVGFSLGGFVMAFNISCYIQSGASFPFLATLSKPFARFCTNNSFIPLVFIISYLIASYRFLNANEAIGDFDIVLKILGLPVGYSIFIILSMAYFMATNKDFEKIFGKDAAKFFSSKANNEPARMVLHKRRKNWYDQSVFEKSWRVDSYLGSRLRLRISRPFSHYDSNMLSQVFRQNHINASFFEIVIILSILALGFFKEVDVFEIPAGATIILLFTMMMMLVSALRSWLHGWTMFVLLLVFLALNFVSQYDNVYFENKAYGMDYSNLVEYSDSLLLPGKISPQEHYKDVEAIAAVLDEWKKGRNAMGNKPKAIFIASSGGGSRSALWTMHAMQHLDSLLQGKLMQQSILITGSSGGLVGAAYFRELFRKNKKELYHKKHALKIAKDLLNPIAFSLATSDIIRIQQFEYNNEMYWKDRGHAFEQALNEITDSLMDQPLSALLGDEKNGRIPLMVFSPSIVSDGRRLLISPLDMSFLTSYRSSENLNLKTNMENIEFKKMFKAQDPLSIRYLTVLRMNASFPYIMPTVDMPTKPSIEVFDAGLRDNYGIKTTVNFIFGMRKWLEENTSGIIILQIRDGLKNSSRIENENRSYIDQILSPFGSLYGNWFKVQDFNNDELLKYTGAWYQGPVDIINYELNKSYEENISLSWHLTSLEKLKVLNSVNLEQNKRAEESLRKLLE